MIAPFAMVKQPASNNPIDTGASPRCIEVRHGHFSEFPPPLGNEECQNSRRPKEGTKRPLALPEFRPGPIADGDDHHHVGSRRHLPDAIEMYQLLEGKPLVDIDGQDLHFREGEIPPPTVNNDKYANTRTSAGIWFMMPRSLSALCVG